MSQSWVAQRHCNAVLFAKLKKTKHEGKPVCTNNGAGKHNVRC